MKINNVFILLLFVLVSVNCSAEYKLKVVYTFKPLSAEEKLSFITFGQDESPYFVAIVFRDNEDKFLDKITEIGPVNYCPKLISNSTKFLYYINDNSRRMKNTYLLDGKEGKTYFLGKIITNYDISDDGRYLCYEIDSKIGSEYTIPGIMWKDLKTGETREYDFSNTFLKDEWGAGPYIRYISDRDVFSFNFFIEHNIFSKGFIKATGGDYQEYRDVIYRGYVNSKNVYLRKTPDSNSEFIISNCTNDPVLVKRVMIDIIGKTENKVKIGNHNDYWYKVRTFSMYEGWIYGEYITLEK